MAKFKGIIAHWAVTRYKADATSKKHYHFIIEGDGKIIAGNLPVGANAYPRTKGKPYVAHTLNCNDGWIGVSCAAMSGAVSESKPGDYPITKAQFESMCGLIARLCTRYGILVSPRTVLSHAEVQGTLGIKQRGKWDIATLPHLGLKGAKPCGDAMRRYVAAYIAGIDPVKKPASPVGPKNEPPSPIPPSRPLSPIPPPENEPAPPTNHSAERPGQSKPALPPAKQGFWASLWTSIAGIGGGGLYAWHEGVSGPEAAILAGLTLVTVLIICYLLFWPEAKD